MELQSWIIGQILIDIIIVLLIIWFIRSHSANKIANYNLEIFEECDRLLSEMKNLSRQFEVNLKEKKELSRNILSRLDDGLQKADETFKQIRKINKDLGTKSNSSMSFVKDTEKIRSSVNALLLKGLSSEEIAQHLGISLGEIDLLIKLQKPV